MFVADTNVLIYAVNDRAPEHVPCRALLERWQIERGPWYLTWGILYEFLRVVSHPRVLAPRRTPAEAWDLVAALLASPGLRVLTETRRHAEVLERLMNVAQPLGNLLHDAHIAALMIEHGISRIYTRDTAFHRFPGIEVLDPLTA